MTKLVCLSFLALLAQLSVAQQLAKLDQDPVFTAVLARRMIFPPNAINAKVYTKFKIYTRFRIDSLGHIHDIATLNPSGTDYGFEREISNALNHLPPLNRAYEGEYILPVRFVFIYSKGVRVAKVDSVVQTDQINSEVVSAYPGQTMLRERRVETYGSSSYRPLK